MPFPVITFNASTGSDTAASGAGPAAAVSGTAAAHTGGAASTTITLTNSPDLSGVATDGSAALWLKTGSGRQFSKITAVDDGADTVTVEDSFTIASGSAVDYAIGGKRATLDNADSRTLFGSTGAKAGWTLQLETDQTLTSAITIAVSGSATTGPIRLKSDSSTRRTINQTANAGILNTDTNRNIWVIEDLKFTNSNGTKTNAYFHAQNGFLDAECYRCIFGDQTNTLAGINTGSNAGGAYYDCEIQYCTSHGASPNLNQRAWFEGCSIHHNVGCGIVFGPNASVTSRAVALNCVVWANGQDGIRVNNSGAAVLIKNCTINGNTGDGIELSGAVAFSARIYNNSITANGGYGINAFAGQDDMRCFIDHNNFGTGATANTSGARNNLTAGPNDLAVDPGYTDAANGDFTITSSSAVYPEGWPDKDRKIGGNPATGTSAKVAIGASQPLASGGGGGGACGRVISGPPVVIP